MVALEIAVRAALWRTAGAYVTYMLLTNWLASFLRGQYCGQRISGDRAWRPSAAWSLLALLPVVWLIVAHCRFRFDQDFPFRAADLDVTWQVVALTAAGVSVLYTGLSWAAYRITDRLPHVALVRFIAANTVVIFVTHMPVYYALAAADAPHRA